MMHQAGVYEKYIKRGLDLLLSGGALLLLWPVLLVLVLLVRAKLGSPAIFCQERPGKNGKVFRLYKLRSMTEERDENGELLSDEERLTPFGRKLRALSLDELPELWNIFRGDMSIVGPRPLLVEYLPYYTEEEMHRHDVRPGLTGWAQVNGRNLLTWEEKFAYDLEYVRNISLRMDCRVIYTTIGNVLRRKDVVSGAELKKIAGRLDDERREAEVPVCR